MMIVCGTGHRPEDSEDEQTVRLKVRETLQTEPVDCFITGCAAGFDLWAADVALDLGIEVWAARPWRGHAPRKGDEQLYAKVLAGASRVHVVTEVDDYPGPWVYLVRNHWMVDNATNVLAYWSGKKRGGTYECVSYAIKKQVPLRNIYGSQEV